MWYDIHPRQQTLTRLLMTIVDMWCAFKQHNTSWLATTLIWERVLQQQQQQKSSKLKRKKKNMNCSKFRVVSTCIRTHNTVVLMEWMNMHKKKTLLHAYTLYAMPMPICYTENIQTNENLPETQLINHSISISIFIFIYIINDLLL